MILDFTHNDEDAGRSYECQVRCTYHRGTPPNYYGSVESFDLGYPPEISVHGVELLEVAIWNPGRKKEIAVEIVTLGEAWESFRRSTEPWLRQEIENSDEFKRVVEEYLRAISEAS